jgi:hypothetical protein
VREGNIWRIKTNKEWRELLRGEDIVRFVKSRRLAWLGHVERMEEESMPRKMLHGRMQEKRCGRPRKRWTQDIEEDLKIMQVRRWWENIRKREEWESITRKAKAHPGL